ncbi:hypothetical protein [Caulobacter henricii]|uniref:Uncharacterized protein n=1 Tax=Caulobacter henricii TaxID=69395 RepID=A0A0P0P2U5_9CAUL|nr:hypothetical protein [Caulobacter henricii]ALL14559.1 hypothetical protein AQ619_15050 [Caulobacter henricii]
MKAIRFLAAIQAVACLGVSLMAIAAAGAGRNALLMQTLAAVVALGLAVVVTRFWRKAGWRYWLLVAACALALVWTLMSGVTLEGARRWLALGPVQLHTASLALPVAAWAFARGFEDRRVAPLAAALSFALLYQHDAASSLAWALALGAATLVRRPRQMVPWAVVVVAAVFAYAAWTEPDTLPAVPYVEGLIRAGFEASPVTGALVAILMFSLPAPFLLVAFSRSERRAEALALAALWTGWIAGNLFGNYPAPVLGYGAGPVLAWGLSLGLVLAEPSKEDEPGP